MKANRRSGLLPSLQRLLSMSLGPSGGPSGAASVRLTWQIKGRNAVSPKDAKTMISAAQCRCARTLLRWSVSKLASDASVSENAIDDFELERRQPNAITADAIRRTFEETISRGRTSTSWCSAPKDKHRLRNGRNRCDGVNRAEAPPVHPCLIEPRTQQRSPRR